MKNVIIMEKFSTNTLHFHYYYIGKIKISGKFILKRTLMNKKLIPVIAILTISLLSGCGTFKKMKDKVSISDVSKIADMINMDFGRGPNGPFKVTKIASSKPELVIDNQTDRTIKVVTSGATKKTIRVNSKKTQTLKVNTGMHHFKASAKGTKGCSGDVELKGFNKYTWVFYIR